jgi:hypothetical protein
METEMLISDSIVASVTLRQLDGHGESEHHRVFAAIKRTCTTTSFRKVTAFGRSLRLVMAKPGLPAQTEFSQIGADEFIATIVLADPEEPAQQIHLRVTLRRVFGDPTESWLEVESSPTTIIAGANVGPAVFAPQGGPLEPNPSSSLRILNSNVRLGFELLDDVYRQTLGVSQSLYSPVTAMNLKRGNFRIVRAQWAAYLPAKDPTLGLQLLAIIFGQTISRGRGIISLATHLGLRYDLFTDQDTHEVTGMLLRKYQGNKPFYSISLYDKGHRIAQMKQGKTLSEEERRAIETNVRLDVTVHAEGIVAMCQAARGRLRAMQKGGKTLPWVWTETFLSGEIRPSALWLTRAVFVLSHELEGRLLIRRSFAHWLVPKILRDTLHLDIVAGFTLRGIRALIATGDSVAVAWHEADGFDDENWAKHLSRAAGCSPATVYARRTIWRKKFGIDIAVSHAWYRDMLYFGPQSLSDPQSRSALTAAVRQRDGAAITPMLLKAAVHFDRKRVEVVGSMIRSGPSPMAVKVVDDTPPSTALPRQERGSGLRPGSQGLRKQGLFATGSNRNREQVAKGRQGRVEPQSNRR